MQSGWSDSGGAIGWVDSTGVTTTNLFWDTQTTGQTTSGSENDSDVTITTTTGGLTTANMQDACTNGKTTELRLGQWLCLYRRRVSQGQKMHGLL